jgi:hypothetical protein
MQAKVWRYLSTTFGEWATSSCFVLYEGRHALSLFLIYAYEFPFGNRGICAYDMFSCWKWTSNRLEAEGNVQIIRAGKHIGMGQAGMAVRGVGRCGISWQGLIHVNALIAFVFLSFLELMNWTTCHVR